MAKRGWRPVDDNDREWKFYQDSEDNWRWVCLGEGGTLEGASLRGFTTKRECVDDAEAFGYKKQRLHPDM